IKELKKTIKSQSFEIAEQNLMIKDSGKQIIQLQHKCNNLESVQQRYKVELKGDKHTFELELSCYKGSIKCIAKEFKWEQMYQDGLAIVVQVSDLELDCLKAEHQAAQATWMKENRDFKKQLTAADNEVNNLNEVIFGLTTELTTHIEELQKKIAVLEEDVWDRCKRLDLELDEKSKTAVQTSISLLNDRLSEEQMQKVEYKMYSESAMVSTIPAQLVSLQKETGGSGAPYTG
ncbi:hypothetical protein H0H87_007728, partial [Tephrocybe sp. NHM501043]